MMKAARKLNTYKLSAHLQSNAILITNVIRGKLKIVHQEVHPDGA
jgi:hypothetical protein